MGMVLTTKDGKNHTILSDNDYVNLLEEYMGTEARKYFDSRFAETIELYDFISRIVDLVNSLYEKLEYLVDNQKGIQKRTFVQRVKEASNDAYAILVKLQPYDIRF